MSVAQPTDSFQMVTDKHKLRTAGDNLTKLLTRENRVLMGAVMKGMSKLRIQTGPTELNFQSRDVYIVNQEEDARLPTKQCVELLKGLRNQNFPAQEELTSAIDFLRHVMILAAFLQLKGVPSPSNYHVQRSRMQMTDLLAQAMINSSAPDFEFPEKVQHDESASCDVQKVETEIEAADPSDAWLLDFEGTIQDRTDQQPRRIGQLVDRQALQQRLRRRRRLLAQGIPPEEVENMLNGPTDPKKNRHRCPPRHPYTFARAFTYLNTFRAQVTVPKLYDDFVQLLRKFHDDKIKIDKVIKCGITLLYDYPNLLAGFNKFLPKGYYLWKRQPYGFRWISPELIKKKSIVRPDHQALEKKANRKDIGVDTSDLGVYILNNGVGTSNNGASDNGASDNGANEQ